MTTIYERFLALPRARRGDEIMVVASQAELARLLIDAQVGKVTLALSERGELTPPPPSDPPGDAEPSGSRPLAVVFHGTPDEATRRWVASEVLGNRARRERDLYSLR